MKLLLNKRKTAAEPSQEQAPVKIAAANWTRGQQLATAATRVALWLLIACAPVALILGAVAVAAAARPAPQAIATQPSEPPGRVAATGIAEHIVTTWLEATRGTEDQLGGLLPAADLPAKALTVTDAGAVESVWDGTAWVVTVGATIASQLPAEDETDQPSTVTQRRFFQVPIAVDEAGQLSVLMLPSEVAGPSIIPAPHPGFRSTVAPSHSVSVAAGEFLTALLAGGGDIARYTSPESGIRSVVPAPYSELVVESVKSRTAVADAPREGDTAVVMVRARANDITGAETRFDYVLAMTLKSSRWEITEIQGSPNAEEVPPDLVESPAPTTHP